MKLDENYELKIINTRVYGDSFNRTTYKWIEITNKKTSWSSSRFDPYNGRLDKETAVFYLDCAKGMEERAEN